MKTRYKRVVTHPHPHLDEIVAYWAAQKFGRLNLMLEFDDNARWSKDVLTLGCGGGPCDEHLQGGGRRKWHSAFTLTLRHFEVQKSTLLDVLYREVLRVDSNGKAQNTHLSRLVDILYRSGKSDIDVVQWCLTALESVYVYVKNHGDEYINRREDCDMKKFGIKNAEDQKFLGRSTGVSKHSLLELSRILNAIEHVHNVSVAKSFASMFFCLLQKDRLLYQEAVSIVKETDIIKVPIPNTPGEVYACVGIESMNTHIIRAYRSHSAGSHSLLVQKCPNTGHVCISVDRKILPSSRVSLKNLYVMLVVQETELLRPGYQVTPARLAKLLRSKEQEDTVWYMMHDAGLILNGSLSHPEVSPTKQTLEDILQTVRCAFHPRLFEVWKKKHVVDDTAMMPPLRNYRVVHTVEKQEKDRPFVPMSDALNHVLPQIRK